MATPNTRSPDLDAGTRLEQLTIWHAAAFVLVASWGFGGNIDWIRTPLALWGTAGALLTISGLTVRLRRRSVSWWPVLWLLPFLALALLILVGTFNPNYGTVSFFERTVYRPVPPPVAWLPSSARPDLARTELWLFSGLYLAGFNLVINVRRRRSLRGLLGVLVLNGVALAVFGTFQKLAGAPGLYFGLQPSPNPAFFASFIYHNHWGAFILLTVAACLGLIDHYGTKARPRDFWHSAASPLLVGLLLLAASIPLSSSRSATLLLVVIAVVAGAHAVRRIRSARVRSGRSSHAAVLVLSLALLLALTAIAWLAAPVLQARLEKTREQFATWQEVGGLGGRERLYRDTWRMALDRPWTGWGFESYETVFTRFNTQGSPRDRLSVHYDQAHSDWLQAIAETGFIGFALLILMAVVPIWTVRNAWRTAEPLPLALLGGCLLVSAYAWVEFPFANPAVVALFWILFFTAQRYVQLAARDDLHGVVDDGYQKLP